MIPLGPNLILIFYLDERQLVYSSFLLLLWMVMNMLVPDNMR